LARCATLDDARKLAEDKLMDGSAYKKFKQVVQRRRQSQGARQLECFPCDRNARDSFARAPVSSAHHGRGYRPRIADDWRGPRHEGKIRSIPAVGVILEVKVGEKVDAGSGALPPLLHRRRESR